MRKLLGLTTIVVISATVMSGALAAGAGAVSAAAVGGGGSPMIRASGTSFGLPTISENWSGYAVTSTKPFTFASTKFVQPAVSCVDSPKFVYTSNWVGLDGFNDQTVEQDGTSGHCNMYSGLPNYYAWIEMYPAADREGVPGVARRRDRGVGRLLDGWRLHAQGVGRDSRTEQDGHLNVHHLCACFG